MHSREVHAPDPADREPARPLEIAPQPAATEALLQRLTQCFYRVVPREYRSFCSLNSSIIQATLHHFGVDSQLEPCQLWCTTPTRNCVVGFVGHAPQAQKWDGHVVCRVGPWLIDAALFHVQRDFGIPCPDIALIPVFSIPTHALGRASLNAETSLWWFHPPAGAALQHPEEPREVVELYAQALMAALQQPESIEPRVASPDH